MFYNGFFGFSILDIPFWVEMAMSYGLIKSGNKIRSIGFERERERERGRKGEREREAERET